MSFVPVLMVTDPPYGVKYDPSWRTKVRSKGKVEAVGKVQNDHIVDWREAYALFPGNVAYVWHAGIYASAVQELTGAQGSPLLEKYKNMATKELELEVIRMRARVEVE